MKLKVIVHEAEEGGFWAEVPALKGCYTQADTHEELIHNINEAVELWLEVAQDGKEIEPNAEVLELAL